LTSSSRNGYPTNIQKIETLLQQVQDVKDMDSLPKSVFKQMQRISEVYLADLGIDVNEKDKKGKIWKDVISPLNMFLGKDTSALCCVSETGMDREVSCGGRSKTHKSRQ